MRLIDRVSNAALGCGCVGCVSKRGTDQPLNDAPKPLQEVPHLWRLMQRVEYCRHRAEMVEARCANAPEHLRNELAEIAQQWRDLALEIEQQWRDHRSDGGAVR